jgi:hypothetical protein
MIHPDHIFKDALYNHETPLDGKASFQGVMQKRKNKRRGFFWFSLSSVLLLLLSLTAASLFKSSATQPLNVVKYDSENAESGFSKDTKDQASAVEAQTASQSTAASGSAPVSPEFKLVREKSASGVIKIASQPGNNRGRSNNADLAISAGSNTNSSVAFNTDATASTDAVASVQLVSGAAQELQSIRDVLAWIKQIKSRGIADDYIFQLLPTEGVELPEPLPFHLPRKARFNPIFELNVTTAGNGYKNFRESQDVTVAGNHRFSQYQGIMLFDMGRGVNIGTGLGYMESVGIGKALISEWKIDTTFAPVRITKAQNISYRLNKVSVPLAIRYQLGFGRKLVRISASAMPGIMTVSSGTMFSRDAIQSMDMLKKNTFVMDARLGAGLYYQVAPKTAISAEPMVQYQAIPGAQWKSFNRFGFGFGLGVVFRP